MNRSFLQSTCAIAVIAMCGTPAFAQGVSPDNEAAEDAIAKMDVVIVSAQRRDQALIDVPISISALDGNRIADAGATNVEDLQYLVPGLHMSHDRTGALRVSIRGISSNVGLESAIAMHGDGVYLSQKLDQSRAFFDVNRVEVLRGPQGTLYGRNATGGAVNIITNDPGDVPEGGVRLEVGNYGLVAGEAYASGPLWEDKVQGRIAGTFRSLEGYGTNAFNNRPANGEQVAAVRGKLNFDLTDTLSVLLSADYSDTSSSYDDEVSRLFPDIPLNTEYGGFVPPTGFDTNTNYPDFQDTEIWGVSARASWDLGGVRLASLTARRSLDRNTGIDVDGSPHDRVYFRSGMTANEQFTQEFTAASAGDNRLDWVLGAYYFDNSFTADRVVPSTISNAIIIAGTNFYDTKAYAVFGEVDYELTDSLSVILGGRYSEEEAKMEDYRFFGSIQGTLYSEDNWSSFTPKAAVVLKLNPQTNVYATYSQGFKSGGFNPGSFNGEGFDPEKVTNYEVGLKGSTPGGLLSGSLAAFYMEYTDLQVNTFVLRDGVPAARIVNAAEATIKGFEGDFTIRPTDNFFIDGSVSYLDAAYDNFLAADNITFANVDASGNRMFDVPETAGTFGATYTQMVSPEWRASLRADMYYQSKVYFTPFEDLRGVSQDGYTIMNARLAFANEASGWELAVFGRNLSDERVAAFALEVSDGAATGMFRSTTYRPPRTFGVSVSKPF